MYTSISLALHGIQSPALKCKTRRHQGPGRYVSMLKHFPLIQRTSCSSKASTPQSHRYPRGWVLSVWVASPMLAMASLISTLVMKWRPINAITTGICVNAVGKIVFKTLNPWVDQLLPARRSSARARRFSFNRIDPPTTRRGMTRRLIHPPVKRKKS